MGIIRRVLNDEYFSNIPILLSGLLLFGLPYLRISQYKNKAFQVMLLASVLIFTVIFSTGSESPTYIIAFVGVALWFVLQPKPADQEDDAGDRPDDEVALLLHGDGLAGRGDRRRGS